MQPQHGPRFAIILALLGVVLAPACDRKRDDSGAGASGVTLPAADPARQQCEAECAQACPIMADNAARQVSITGYGGATLPGGGTNFMPGVRGDPIIDQRRYSHAYAQAMAECSMRCVGECVQALREAPR